MLKRINNYIYLSMLISVICIIFGIVCIINPSISFEFITIVVTSIFIVNGLLLLIVSYKSNFIFMDTFPYGILSFIIGIILLIYPNSLKMILPIMVGIWFMVSGLFHLKLSYLIKEESVIYMIVTIMISIISVICGFVLIKNPLESVNILAITLAITLLLHSISNIVDLVIAKKYRNRIVKKVKNYISDSIE